MKQVLLVGLILIGSFVAKSQDTRSINTKFKLSGRILDSATKKSIDYATITVFTPNNVKPVNGATSNEKGLFNITELPAGDFKVVVDFIGYKSRIFEHIFLDNKNPARNLGDITLEKRAQTLQAVTVTGKSGLIENKIDKMIYNAEKDLTAQGGVATDLLKKIPQVSVDIDGNVELQGNSNVRFLIDGKPSTIFGNNLADALQSLPASQIKSIEVITSPGAKYDAEGTGGIINIILKKTTIQGINGNISLSAGSRLENGSLNLNAKKGTFSLHGFLSGNAQLESKSFNTLNRFTADTSNKTNISLLQDGSSAFKRNGYETGLGFDWDLTKKDNISGSVGYDHFGNSSHGYSNQQQLTYFSGSGNVLAAIYSLRNSANRSHSGSLDWDLNYKRKFKEDEELEISYSSSSGRNHADFNLLQQYLSNDSIFSGTKSTNPGNESETNIGIDYVKPLSEKVNLEFGGKTNIRSFNSNSSVYSFNPSSGIYLYDTRQSYMLDYKRNVYALYSSVSFGMFDFLNIKSGLRYERTETKVDYSNAHNVTIPGYNTLVPSLYISHNFENEQAVKISYNRRIQRPGYRALNPFVNAVDPKNISRGNPDLDPELSDNIEAGYSKSFEKGGSINVSLFYRRNSQDIQPYIVYYPTFLVGDSVYTNVSVSTSENIGLEKNKGLNFYGSVPLTTHLNIRSNLSAFHRKIINRFVPGNSITSFNYRINLNATYQFNGNLAAEFFGNFSSAHNEAQGKMPSFISYNLAIRKQFLKKKASLGFTTTNPFNKYVNQVTNLQGPNFEVISNRRISYRSFGLSFTYKFGRLEFKKETEDIPEANTPPDND